jgi:hypothetical protein
MVKSAASEYQTIDECHRYAYFDTAGERAQGSARGRPMDKKSIIQPAIGRRYHKWSLVNAESEVTDKPFVENLVNPLPLEDTTLR